MANGNNSVKMDFRVTSSANPQIFIMGLNILMLQSKGHNFISPSYYKRGKKSAPQSYNMTLTLSRAPL